MNHDTEDRVRALETALQSCIGYLKRMPLSPLTIEQVRAAQGAMDAANPVGGIGLIGDIRTPVGVLAAGAIVRNGEATVFTDLRPGSGENLLLSLRRGITFRLHPIGMYTLMPNLDK